MNIQQYLEKGGDKNILNQMGENPMYTALLYGQAEVFRLLFLYGAKVIPPIQDQGTPLHMAIKFGHQELAKMLLGENQVFPNYKNVRDDRGYTPLHIASFRGDEFMVSLLLKNNAQVDIKGNDGKTPYDMCIENVHFDV